jgi:hypothetical protein
MREYSIMLAMCECPLICVGTRCCPIRTSGRCMMHMERQDWREELEVAEEEWTPKICSVSCSVVEVDSSAEVAVVSIDEWGRIPG